MRTNTWSSSTHPEGVGWGQVLPCQSEKPFLHGADFVQRGHWHVEFNVKYITAYSKKVFHWLLRVLEHQSWNKKEKKVYLLYWQTWLKAIIKQYSTALSSLLWNTPNTPLLIPFQLKDGCFPVVFKVNSQLNLSRKRRFGGKKAECFITLVLNSISAAQRQNIQLYCEHYSQPSPDAGEGIEEVRRCVAPVIQHLVKREDVVVDAVVGEVSVFDAAKSDRSLSFG